MAKHPVVIGLNVCREIIANLGTGSVSLVDCVRKVRVDAIPSPSQPFTVSCLLADGVGDMTVTLFVTHLSTSHTLVNKSWKIRFSDPLEERWLHIKLKALMFPLAGKYEFLLLMDGEWLASKTVYILPEKETP